MITFQPPKATSGPFRAALVIAVGLFLQPLLVSGASCGTYGSLRHPQRIGNYGVPGSNKVGLVAGCQQACLDSERPCHGFSVNLRSSGCETYSNIMEKQGMARSDSYDTLHYDMSCFNDVSTSQSTQAVHNLTNIDDHYVCQPKPGQVIFNPSFETGIWISYAHGWTLHGSSEDNMPRRAAIGDAVEGDTNLVFEVLGAGSSSVSQTLCVVPGLKYELTAHIGHKSSPSPLGAWEFYYRAPTVSVYLDRDLVYRNSVCGPEPNVQPTECQPSDGTYYPLSLIVKPWRSTPTLTISFDFNAPEGKKSYKGLLDLVQLSSAEPAI